MKRIIIILILLLGGLAARADNIVSISSANGHPQDEVTLNVSLANTDAAVAFQAEIPLGSQLTYVAGSAMLNAERVTDHQMTAAVVDGTLKIFAYSLSLTPFVGTEGNLLSFTLRLKNEPGDYPITFTNAILSNASGDSLPLVLSVPSPQVTILSPKLQINTTTLNYGHVPIRSEYTQNASVTNVGNELLTITGITFGDAVFSCPSFTETILQAGESASFTFKFAPMEKGAVTATATVASNSISGNGIISLVADPFAVNEIHVGNVTGYCDSIVALPISMNNMEDILGFQIEANLNDALEFVDFTLSDRKTDHVATGVVSGTTLRLMAYSPSGAAFTGDDGEIGTVRFRLHGMYGNYYLNPTKALLADALGENVLSAKYQGRVTVRSPRINGNNALSFGSSPVTEMVSREYTIQNNGNAAMRIDQVVFDQEGFAVAETMPLVVEQNASTTLHVSYSREQAGDFSALMKIYSNDPQNGLKNVALSGMRYEPNGVALSVDPFSLGNGDVAVALSMNNYSGIVALQANFQYPYQDYSLTASDFQLTDRFASHSLYAMPINDSTFRVLVLSMQNNTVNENDGTILNVTLHPIAMPSEEDYTVMVSQIVLSEAGGQNVYTGQAVSVSFSLATATQSFELAEGWNWWAPMVYVSLAHLEDALDGKGITINSQSAGSVQYSGSQWSGDLQRITPGQMYRIRTNEVCSIDLTGMSVASSSIDLHPGLTWFGYVGVQKPIAQALSGFHPAIGDKINSQNGGFAIYGNNGWSGTLQTLKTGHGYVYHSATNNTKTLTLGASCFSNGSYTPVDYIWSDPASGTHPSEATLIETGINLNDVSKVRCKMKPMMPNGWVWIGNIDDSQGGWDSKDFRVFSTDLSASDAYTYFDYKGSRDYTRNSYFRTDVEVDITIEISSSYAYLYLTGTGSTSNYLFRNTVSGSLSDVDFLALLNCIKLGVLQIWDVNGVLVRDLKATLDENNTPCMYDEVNQEFIHASGVERTMYYE